MAVQVDSGVEHDRHKRVPRASLSSRAVDSSKAYSVRSKGTVLTENLHRRETVRVAPMHQCMQGSEHAGSC